MPKANQRAIWERGSQKMDAPSKRTEPSGLLLDNGDYSNKYHNAPHNRYPQGMTGYNPKISRL